MKALGSMGDRMQEESRFRVLAQSLIGNVQANPIGWRDLRIPQGGMLVNYAIVGLASNPRAPHVSHYAAVLARSGETPSWKVLAPCTEVDAVVRELHGLLALGVATPTPEAPAEELLQKLHSQLVTPWMPLASGTTRDLFIVPDGELHAVPFACLMEKWEFLGDRFTLHQLKSCRSLLGAKPTKLASRAVESWGNPNYSMAARPMAESGGIKAFFKDLFRDDRAYGDLKELPGTGEEATIVEEIFTAKGYAVNKRTWNDANEANIRQLASPYVLHIGTHGIIRTPPTNQTDTDIIGLTNERFQSHGAYYTSGIALSGASFARQSWKEGTALAPDTDGIILSSEVARLRLTGTKLVTLSACDSGAGTAAAGEGVLGLKSALFQAGAENVLLALWRVDDAYAPEFFRVFYQEFVKDGNPANALSVAQRKAFKEIRGRTKGNLFKTVRMAGPFVVTER